MEVAVESPVDVERQPPSQPLDPVPTENPQQQQLIMPPANPPFPISTTTTDSAAPGRPSEPQMPSPPPEAVPPTANAAQPAETDAMDTTPDQTSQPEPAPEPLPEPLPEQDQTQDPPPVEASNAMDTDVPMVPSEVSNDPQTVSSEQAPTEGGNGAEVNNTTAADAPNPAAGSTGDSSEASTQPTSEGSTESNESSDSSADEDEVLEEKEEEEAAYWADIEEDTSSPDEAELKEIEASDLDYSAYKYDYWEKNFYPTLQDPEYRPSQKARLTWKIKGVRGTKEKPNRATIIRSPPAYIGGYYWTVKFFPRGNSVSSLSVYIECSKTPPEQDKETLETEFKVVTGPPDAVLGELTPDVDLCLPATVAPKNKQEPSSPEGDSQKQETNGEAANNADKVSDESEPAETKDGKKDWRVSAQIGVIIYNPDEPRTACSQSSSHQFNPHNVDWGWTHFHGPWDQIHRRHNGQRQALLRNDTLAFDAYIRIFDDSTQSLWWHESDAEPVWDSLSLTGYRPMGDPMVDYSYEVAGLVSWLLIAPFREIIQNVDISEHLTNANVKPRILCSALQRMLWATHNQPACPDLYISTEHVTTALRNLREFSGDTSEFWERLRRTLELELEGTDAIEKLAKIFDSPRIEGLPDYEPAQINHLPQGHSTTIRVPVKNSKSIQGATTKFLRDRPGQWSLPSVLHVEMVRQTFDKPSRQWNMLFDRVKLDEKLDLSDSVVPGQSGKYDLYGMVVHKGSRSSGRFFSVLRPGGPDTRWLAFEDSSNNKITCLTRRGAIDDHEGLDADELMQSGEKCTPDVAVIAMYVRSDSVKEYLTGKIEPWDVPFPTAYYFTHGARTLDHVNGAEQQIKVELYSLSDLSRISESLVDSYDVMAASKSAGEYSCITLPPETTFAELRKKVAVLKSTEEEVVSHEKVRFWELGSYRQFAPTLRLHSADPLDAVSSSQLSILRLWVHILSEEDATRFALPEPREVTNSFEYESGETPVDGRPQESQDEQNAVQNTENAAEAGDAEMNDAPTESQVAPVDPTPVTTEEISQPSESQPEPDNQPMIDAPMATSTEIMVTSNEAPAEPEPQPEQETSPSAPAPQEEQPSNNNAQETVEPGPAPTDADVAMADDVAIAALIAEEVEALDRLDNHAHDAMDAEPSPPPEEPSTHLAGTEEGQAAPTSTSDQISDESPLQETPPAQQEEREATPSPADASPAEEDTDMADPPSTENPETQASGENPYQVNPYHNTTSESNPEPPRSKLISPHRQVYYFIQQFDEQKQELRLIKSVFAKKSHIIKESIRAALGWPEDKPFLLWHRVDGISAIAVSGSETFDNVVSYLSGECFVVGDVLDKAQRTELAQAGMFSAPDMLIHYLWALKRRHPTKAFSGTQTAEATFNGDYFSGQFKNGYYHGKGTHISDSGTTYTGDFILGERQGKGLMEYASGDTYDGDWVEDQRDGHGTSIERKTGNKYVGGYRNGKRHGKGISYWEVADEEMDLCQICYSENQDSLFYSCGHVCACVSCARQVDICPMCRKKVLNVVKIYKS